MGPCHNWGMRSIAPVLLFLLGVACVAEEPLDPVDVCGDITRAQQLRPALAPLESE